jgi:hypothetical protein
MTMSNEDLMAMVAVTLFGATMLVLAMLMMGQGYY